MHTIRVIWYFVVILEASPSRNRFRIEEFPWVDMFTGGSVP